MAIISIIEYQPRWVEEFATIATEIRAIVGTSALRVDHIGSTSIAGLAAKDVIDIQMTIVDLNDQTAVLALVQHGYELREQVTHDLLVGTVSGSPELRKMYLREPTGRRTCHLHVREQGRLNQAYPLLFRDYLRSDQVVREAYAEVKRVLAGWFPDDSDAYYQVKDPYMDTIYQSAKLWAQLHHWTPDADFY